MGEGRTSIMPRSPSGEVLPPPNPRRTHGRTGRATVTAGTLGTVGDDVAGEDVKRYVKGRDADRDDANVMHGRKCDDLAERRGGRTPSGCVEAGSTPAVVSADFTESEALRQGRLRRWQAIR